MILVNSQELTDVIADIKVNQNRANEVTALLYFAFHVARDEHLKTHKTSKHSHLECMLMMSLYDIWRRSFLWN